MKYFLIVTTLWVFKTYAYAQTRNDSINFKLQNADTVLLVSHESTEGIPPVGMEITMPELMVDGRPNKQIIKEQQIIKDDQLKRLTKIISKPFKGKYHVDTGCYDPHHTIFLMKDGKVSYIDICFHCLGFETSKDLKGLEDWNEDKWKEMKDFFISLGFKYELKPEN